MIKPTVSVQFDVGHEISILVTLDGVSIKIDVFTISIIMETSIQIVTTDCALGVGHSTTIVFVVPLVTRSVQFQVANTFLIALDGLSVKENCLSVAASVVGLRVCGETVRASQLRFTASVSVSDLV